MRWVMLFLLVSLLLIAPQASAYDIVSAVYDVVSYHLGISGDEAGSATHDSRFTLTTEGTGELNSSDYEGNVGWLEQGTAGEQEETEEPVGEVTPSRGGTTGGTVSAAPSCYYNWSCTSWFPFECPEEGFQERICINRGTCNGTDQMPVQRRDCEWAGPFEPIFDVFLQVHEDSRSVCIGDDVEAEVRLVNFGKLELLDAYLTYWVVDENNKLISEMKDTRAVMNATEFDVWIKLPSTLKEGNYRVYAEILYDVNKTAVAGDSFEVTESELCELRKNVIGPLIEFLSVIIISIIAIVLVIIYMIHRASKREDKKVQGEMQKIARKNIQMVKIGETTDELRKMVKELRKREDEKIDESTKEIKEEMEGLKKSMEGYAKKDELKKIKKGKAVRKEVTDKPVEIKLLAKFVGKTITIEADIRKHKEMDEAGVNVSWYKISDKSGNSLMSSYEKISEKRARMNVEVRKTENGYVYALFKEML